jgi:hypothetical protein
LTIDKNNRGDKIIVAEVTTKTSGNTYLDIRQFFTNDDDQVMPTKKGIRFNTEIAPEIILAMAKSLQIDEMEDLRDKLDELINLEDTGVDCQNSEETE